MKKKYFFLFIFALIISFLVVMFNFYFLNPVKTNAVFKELTEEEVITLFNQGKKKYYDGNIEEAINIYEHVLANQPNSEDVLKNLYFINKELGNLDKSLEYINKILEINKNNYYWKYKYGVNLYLYGDFIKAKRSLKDAYLQYESTEIMNDDTIVKNTINQLSDKEISLLFYYLGQIYSEEGDYQNAEHMYKKGINSFSHMILNYIGLADLYKNNKEYDEAIEFYNNALNKDSSFSHLYPQLAELHEIIGDDSRAFYYWNRSLATGNRANYARRRIEEISSKHPEFIEKEIKQKDLKRKDIKWVRVEDYLLDELKIPQIRVGIVDNVNKVSFKAGNDFEIKDNDDKVILNGIGDEAYSIEYNNSTYMIYHNQSLIKTIGSQEAIRLINKDKRHTFLLYDISYGEGYFWAGTEDRQYRGIMEMYPLSNGDFNIINVLNLEEYLFSVVPAEMPAWWPAEAIKAQIIAARSYALSNLKKHARGGYDLCDTVHCAAYNGVKSETSKTNQLIIETLGEVAIFNGKPIGAVFSSNSGGYSEKSEEIWGYENVYLKGANNMLNNDYEFPLEPYELEQWLIEEPASFSNNSSYAGYNTYRWIKILDSAYFIEKYNLKGLKDVIPVGRTEGGTVNKVIIKGSERKVETSGDSIRSSLGGLKSNRFVMEKVYSNDNKIDKVIFYGSGWGHHVGMDQTGAAGMAAENYNYKEIIKHFYQETSVEKNY